MTANSVHTPTGMSYLDAHGIIRTSYNDGHEETLADARASFAATLLLFGGIRRPILVDLRSLKSQDRDARAYYASAEVTRHTNALALLVNSRVSMVIANFFISVTKSTTPSRLFTDEAAAVEWLKGYLA